MSKDFGLGILIGVTSSLAVLASTILAFVLFCPIWQEWTTPERAELKVYPQIHIDPPKWPINFPDEHRGSLPDILPKNE